MELEYKFVALSEEVKKDKRLIRAISRNFSPASSKKHSNKKLRESAEKYVKKSKM